jgi:hypothetical protein
MARSRQFRDQELPVAQRILDRDEVLAFRQRCFEAFRSTGLVAPDSDPVDGIYSGGRAQRPDPEDAGRGGALGGV